VSAAESGDGRLAGHRVLVIGASSGVGRAIGLQASAVGATVGFAARRIDLLEEAVDEARSPASAIVCDVCDETSVEGAVGQMASTWGGIDAVVYATGIDPLIRIENVDAEMWARLFATNVVGASLAIRAALPHLKEVGGRAVLISATSVGRPLPGMGAYASSKAALEELARAWRSEHPEVSFSSVAIGMTLGTEVTSGWDSDLLTELAAVWDGRGYLFDNGPGFMGCDEVAETIVSVLAAPTCIPSISVLPDPAAG
jgi:NAD(P)-dependent dehydrogenase (short-subunit alcohol dehydrogenase family)